MGEENDEILNLPEPECEPKDSDVQIVISWNCPKCEKVQKEVRAYERPGDYAENVKKIVKNVGTALKYHLEHETWCTACSEKWKDEKEKEIEKKVQCRECGCTDDKACEGGCRWVEPDLCSKCYEKKK